MIGMAEGESYMPAYSYHSITIVPPYGMLSHTGDHSYTACTPPSYYIIINYCRCWVSCHTYSDINDSKSLSLNQDFAPSDFSSDAAGESSLRGFFMIISFLLNILGGQWGLLLLYLPGYTMLWAHLDAQVPDLNCDYSPTDHLAGFSRVSWGVFYSPLSE